MQSHFLINLKELVISIFLIVTVLSCNKKIEKRNSKRYYYKLTKSEVIKAYEIRDYVFLNDTIKETVTFLDKNGKMVGNLKKNTFLITQNGLDLLIRYNKNKRVQRVYFTTILDSCNNYTSKFFDENQNCYKGKVDFFGFKNTYKINHSNKVIDGVNKNIYIDNDFTFIGLSDVHGTAYDIDEEVRISKGEIPDKILGNDTEYGNGKNLRTNFIKKPLPNKQLILSK